MLRHSESNVRMIALISLAIQQGDLGFLIKAQIHWQRLVAKWPAFLWSALLALATLGGMTQMGLFLFVSLGQGK
jgi:hypothetical protein